MRNTRGKPEKFVQSWSYITPNFTHSLCNRWKTVSLAFVMEHQFQGLCGVNKSSYDKTPAHLYTLFPYLTVCCCGFVVGGFDVGFFAVRSGAHTAASVASLFARHQRPQPSRRVASLIRAGHPVGQAEIPITQSISTSCDVRPSVWRGT